MRVSAGASPARVALRAVLIDKVGPGGGISKVAKGVEKAIQDKWDGICLLYPKIGSCLSLLFIIEQ